MPHFWEYAFVTPKIGAFLGGATTFCLKPSERERAERCASERPPPPPPRPRFGAIFRKISDFLHNFGVVKKSPPPRLEPTVSPIFGRGRDQYARSLSFTRARFVSGAGIRFKPKKIRVSRGRGPTGGSFFWPGPVTDSGRPPCREPSSCARRAIGVGNSRK